jgi:hypothetical protein
MTSNQSKTSVSWQKQTRLKIMNMMKKHLIFFLFFNNILVAGYAQSYQIGHKQQTFIYASRSNRNIRAEIYYPSTTAGDNVAIVQGKFPVLVFGHGFVMTWSSYSVVWNAIVPAGYIMVFPTTESSFSPSHSDFGKDIAFLVGAMKAECANSSSTFSGAVAATSCVMGHSMGGGSAFLAVQYDSTITALATLAAAVTNPSSIKAATKISIPSITFSGANDCVTPPSSHQIPMYDSLASRCKTYVSITGGSHCQFAGYNFNCSLGESSCSPKPAITPIEQQTITFNMLVPWLNFYLKNDCSAGIQFQNLISAGAGITSKQNCTVLCDATGFEAQPFLSWSVYPNPFFSSTTFKTDIILKVATLTIYNIYGKQVLKITNISGQTIELQRDNLPCGVYLMRLTQENKLIATDKLIITD